MGEIINAEISEMNMLGNGITKQDGCVVFCLGAVDGDIVEAEITQVKKNFKIAEIVKIKKESEHRCTVDCKHYNSCGACMLRHISYEHELEIKKMSIESAMRRAGLADVKVNEILYSDSERYRNKVVFHFGENGDLGYMNEGDHNIERIDNCLICPELFCEISAYAENALRPISHMLTYLFIRANSDLSEINVVVGVKKGKIVDLKEFAEKICASYPQIVGVLCGEGYHPEEKNDFSVVYGDSYVITEFCGLEVKVSAASFFQVNYSAAEMLCEKVAQLACPMPGEFGADLYCGTGTLGLVTASMFEGSFITGVEINEKAVADAKENAANNGLTNIGYYSGDSADFVKSAYGAIDFAIIDPPRSGCSDKMIKDLTKLKPSRIVCVSCAPDTLARDLKKLVDSGYEIKETVMCDLFPRTKHVETIAYLVRSN